MILITRLLHFNRMFIHAHFVVDYSDTETKLDFGPVYRHAKNIKAMDSLIPFSDSKRRKPGT